ncbi:unnamed protein product [Owenia fusiformis]|uniref:Glutamate receptor 1 n=1 Tax=Owenia fusiformis TaxID=6347 RepID=A0A8S4NB04_OWEFU|nr:unnamed protein product [Owenia fusiformis]
MAAYIEKHWTLYIVLVLVHNAFGYSIPIGALIDDSNTQAKTAFSFAIMKFNKELKNENKKKSIEIHLESNMKLHVDMSNPYQVTNEMCRHLNRGVFAFIGFETLETSDVIRSFSKRFQVPFISIGGPINTTFQENPYGLRMQPYYIPAVVDIIDHNVKANGWDVVYYVYNKDDIGMIRLSQYYDLMIKKNIKVTIRAVPVKGVEDAYKRLLNLVKGEMEREEEVKPRRLILELSREEQQQLIEKHLSSKIPASAFHYVLGGMGINELSIKNFKTGGVNITGIQLIDKSSETVKTFLKLWADLDSKEWKQSDSELKYEAALAYDAVTVIYKAVRKLFDRNRKALEEAGKPINCTLSSKFDNKSDVARYGPKILAELRNVAVFNGLSESVRFDNKTGERKDFKLELLDTNINRGLARFGYWGRRANGLTVHGPKLIRPWRVFNETNATFIVTTILQKPFIELKYPEKKGNARFEGYCADLAALVANKLKIKYELRVVKDGKYGSQLPNKTWNGMVGELTRNEAQIAIAPLTITSQREKVIGFSKPFMSVGISIMIKKPDKAVPSVFSFLRPLSYEIWMCIIFAFVGVSVVLFLVSRFSPYEWHVEDTDEGFEVTNDFSICNSLWFSLGSFMQQGGDVNPRSMSGRIVGSVWWFFTLIVISSYTANLAAFLTSERMNAPIESAEDLAKQSAIKYGSVIGGSTLAFFKTSRMQTYERMWNFMKTTTPTPFVDTNKEGIERVRKEKGKYAFLLESTMNEYENNRYPCDTMKVGSNLDSKGYGIGTPLGSQLSEPITLAVLEALENGELLKLEKKWWLSEENVCKQDDGKPKDASENALKMANVAGIFYIMLVGLCIAIVVALLEFIYKCNAEANKKKTSLSAAIKAKFNLAIKGNVEYDEAQQGEEIQKSMSTVEICKSSTVQTLI